MPAPTSPMTTKCAGSSSKKHKRFSRPPGRQTPTSPAPEVEYLLALSEAPFIVCEDQEQFDKVLSVRERLPQLQARHAALDDELLKAMERWEALEARP